MKRKRFWEPVPNGEVVPLTQAERILRKFGNARRLAAVLLLVGRPRNPASIYKWTYPREKGGTGGIVPTSAWPDLLLAARYAGILIDSELMDVRRFKPTKSNVKDQTWSTHGEKQVRELKDELNLKKLTGETVEEEIVLPKPPGIFE